MEGTGEEGGREKGKKEGTRWEKEKMRQKEKMKDGEGVNGGGEEDKMGLR